MTTHTPKLTTIARIVLGLIFFVFGLNGFLHFIPAPPPTGAALTFFSGLLAAGYFFPLLKTIEVLASIALLTNRFVPLALAVLAPIVVNIVAFHVFLAPVGLPLAALVLVAEIILARAYRESFAPMLRARTSPVGAQASTHQAVARPAAT
jgi:uncharacterized membrane protein YphA (DoxX/SURF4 family)